jgi:hypothetical protein
MDQSRADADLIARCIAAGILQDPHRPIQLDEPVPMRVLLASLLQLMERLDPPDRPYD